MGLQEEIDERFASAPWAGKAQELGEQWQQLIRTEDPGKLTGEVLGVAFAAIGTLVDTIVELAGNIEETNAALGDLAGRVGDLEDRRRRA
jgi:hypothetical protein